MGQLFVADGQAPAPTRPELAANTLARPDYHAIYGEYPGEPYAIRAFEYEEIDPRWLRQTVEWKGAEPPGTIIVDPPTSTSISPRAPARRRATASASAARAFRGTAGRRST